MPQVEVIGPMSYGNRPRQLGEVLDVPEQWAKIFVGLGRAKMCEAEKAEQKQPDQARRSYKRKDMVGKTETK
ncbi:hypothetical protein [Diaphorobacter caeni]|uniref:hypothetical protein n=1 Tax=Diaphorobacter caeni TaxID=2784387 RepID=UPI00188FD5F8|nr:hypothetical protein [Diaphorobacter caeni]MBF5006000.1 hypothetical protein [Diaphorobacter caeni]